MGLWVIGYGILMAAAPALRRSWGSGRLPGPDAVRFWAELLTPVPALFAFALWRVVAHPGLAIVVGLVAFGVVFAMNSSINRYMVPANSQGEAVSLNMDFYSMANASGRLVGTLLSAAVFLVGGMQACLWCSAALVLLSWICSLRLPAARMT